MTTYEKIMDIGANVKIEVSPNSRLSLIVRVDDTVVGGIGNLGEGLAKSLQISGNVDPQTLVIDQKCPPASKFCIFFTIVECFVVHSRND